MPTTPTGPQRDRALDRLRVLTPAQAIRDPELNQALAPFRGHPPTALMCGNATCKQPVLWCALDPITARVQFSAAAPGEAGATGPAETGRMPAPYDRWEPDDAAGISTVAPGEPMLRWRFFCPRCDRTWVLSNARMISLIVRTLAAGGTSISQAAE